MRKLPGLLLISVFVFTCVAGHCTHVHDDQCGYDPVTKEGCTHRCDMVDPLGVEREPNY